MQVKSQQATNKSPYTLFFEWLFDGNPNSNIEEDILRQIEPVAILRSLCAHSNLTLYLNRYLNTYDVYRLNRLSLFRYLKSLLQKHSVSKKSLAYFEKKEKESKYLRELSLRLPHLKTYELQMLIDDHKDSVDELLGKTEEIKKTKVKGYE